MEGHRTTEAILHSGADHLDDALEVGIDPAVAALALGAADGQEGEVVLLHNGLGDPVTGLADKLQGGLGVAALHGVDDLGADVVQGQFDIHPQGSGEADGGIRIDGKNFLVGVVFTEDFDDNGRQTGFAHAALTCQG